MCQHKSPLPIPLSCSYTVAYDPFQHLWDRWHEPAHSILKLKPLIPHQNPTLISVTTLFICLYRQDVAHCLQSHLCDWTYTVSILACVKGNCFTTFIFLRTGTFSMYFDELWCRLHEWELHLPHDYFYGQNIKYHYYQQLINDHWSQSFKICSLSLDNGTLGDSPYQWYTSRKLWVGGNFPLSIKWLFAVL